ncbi:MAG: PIN domain-containing protein [Deltaproteobacteria bacterium]|nr:PIN domain-containing protein [Deltaproteobacteria bacterium]
MTTSETSLLDTNVLVYAADETSPFHATAKAIRERGLKGEISICVCPQVLIEFFAVVTDSKRVSNPRTQEEAQLEIEKYTRSGNISKIYPGPNIVERILDLLKR